MSPRSAGTMPAHIIHEAVVRTTVRAPQRLLDRAFALAFRGLVYAQIWEDPVIDMAALDIAAGMHIVCIASGSCNALSYLTAGPAAVTAVDLNTAHIALGRLKLAAVRHLPDYDALRCFFVEADNRANIDAYYRFLAPHLDRRTRRYWEGRDAGGRRRITGFAHGIYKRGLLGNFIGMAHLLARIYHLDPRIILTARTLEEQRHIFEEQFAPVFDRRFIRWLVNQPASLFGLGIPPAQYDALAGGERMAEVLRQRLEKLACDFPVADNYFAWQAFSRSYGKASDAPLPPWLDAGHYACMREYSGRMDLRHANLTDHLISEANASLDRYLLLDAQDWMSDSQLTALWREITRTAQEGARVLFRTAAQTTLLPGRVPEAILSRWSYSEEEARTLIRADRSSIYGGLHLYRFKG